MLDRLDRTLNEILPSGHCEEYGEKIIEPNLDLSMEYYQVAPPSMPEDLDMSMLGA